MPRLKKGSTIGNYRIEEQIGKGGMGVVYRATHLGLERPVALKLIAEDLSEDEGFRERFRREPRIAASIEHENVIPVLDAGESEGHLYVTMRLIEGDDLGTILKRDGPLDPERAAAIVAQVAKALDAAHARSLVHRDVKPANVLIELRGDKEHAYLTDFGITKAGGGSIALTRTGDWVGTADYVAPEQIEGEKIDNRTDIYALGAVLYHSLAGEAPFAKESEVAKIYAHLSKPVPPLSKKRKDVSPELEATIRRAMAKKPKDRYATAGEFGREAVSAAGGQGGISRATQKLIGAESAVSSAAVSAGETVVSSGADVPERTAAPKPRRRLRRPRRPSPQPKPPPPPKPPAVKPEPVAAPEAMPGKPQRELPKPAVTKPPGREKVAEKPAATGKPRRAEPGPPARLRANRTAMIGLGAVGIVLLGVAGFALGSSGGKKSSHQASSAAPSAAAASSSGTASANPGYADAVNAAVARVDSATKVKLKAAAAADTSSAQAAPLGDLAAVCRRAAASLVKQAQGPQLKAANAAIIAAFAGLGGAYGKMASAARSGDETGYNAGKSAVRIGEQKLKRALSQLGTLGFEVTK